MRLNDENYEWIMVELLEGNLSKKDELLVMEQIEEDEFFFKQWKLFKHTEIQADILVNFPNKENLFKPVVQSPRRVVPFYGIAASIIFGILVIVFWPSKLSEKELVQLVQPLDYQSIETLATEKNEVIQEVENITQETPSKHNHLVDLSESMEEIVFTKPAEQTNERIPVIEDSTERYDKIVNVFGDKFLVMDHPDAPDTSVVQQIINRDKLSKNELPLEPKIGEKLIAFVTNRPVRRIRDKTTNIVHKMKNPNLKIQPTFEGRNSTLDIHFESEGYVAMANFQPFKNKN